MGADFNAHAFLDASQRQDVGLPDYFEYTHAVIYVLQLSSSRHLRLTLLKCMIFEENQIQQLEMIEAFGAYADGPTPEDPALFSPLH